jgi:hypothetical protein
VVEIDPWAALLIWLGQGGADLGHLIALPFQIFAAV